MTETVEPVPYPERLMIHIANASEIQPTKDKTWRKLCWSFVLNFTAMMAILTLIPVGVMFVLKFVLPRL